MSSVSTAEARFLQSREKRFQERNSRQNNSNKHQNDDVVSFWKHTRDLLQQWSDRLHEIHLKNHDTACLTASQRIQTEDQLDSLLLELQQLRKQCLTMSDSNQDFELPAADVRLLHEEFTKHAMKLDSTRQQLCPPTKFVFKRYRAAMRARAEHTSCHEVNEIQSKQQRDTRQTQPQQVTYMGNVLEKYSDTIIVVEQDGSIRIRQRGTDDETTIPSSSNNNNDASLLLQDLQNCDVTLNGNSSSSYKALHLQHLDGCTVRLVASCVEGAVHVTACHNVQLYIWKCHQLRLHDSVNLHCHIINVGSPPILEDCTSIVFYATPNNSTIYDTKDFNWLRNGIPSPNFSIVEEEMTIGENDNKNDAEPVGKLMEGDETDPTPLKVPTVDSEELQSSKSDVESDDEL